MGWIDSGLKNKNNSENINLVFTTGVEVSLLGHSVVPFIFMPSYVRIRKPLKVNGKPEKFGRF